MKSLLLKHSGRAATMLLVIAIFFLVIPCTLSAAEPALRFYEDGVVQEVGSGRMWQAERSKRLRTNQDANSYLETLNRGKFNDWRLPTRQELFDLVALFDLKENGEVKIQLEGGYWLIGENGQVEVGAWEIGDQCGPSRTYFKKKAGYVRPVRP